MPTPHAYIAAWDEGFAVHLDDAGLAWLDAWSVDRYISIVTEGHRILVCPDDGSDNPEMRRRVSYKGRGAHTDFKHGALFTWDMVQGDDLPRFALCECRLEPSANGLYLFADLPADHLLPWPKLRECASYTMPEQVVRDLEKRMKSARDSHKGLAPSKWTWVPMPKKFREMLAKGVYGDCLKAVIAGEVYAR